MSGRRPPRAGAWPAPRGAERRPARDARAEEVRLYGMNACRAAFAHRPQALRKVYLTEARIPLLKDVLAWCVQHRLGYRVVEDADLERLTASRHHEGVCFDMLRALPLAFDALLDRLPPAPAASLLVWLDGVGNPHNLGAMLRSAAHFGVDGMIAPAPGRLEISGAAARVAEGGAEAVAFAHADDPRAAFARLRETGHAIAATVPRDGVSLFDADLPARLVFVLGAEGEGMDAAMIEASDLRLTIPGSGAVESLNVAASTAVLLGEYRRRHRTAAHA